ncbi:MAG: CHASE3 domain-containing protein, partial [Patescibacteria group bacterium]|nr:CHASE3 domain-containing protein [Patescibacteria group bacterium]
MKSWFGKLIPVIFLCAFFFTTFSLFTIVTNVSTLQTSEALVSHTSTVESTIDDLRAHIITAENEQRTYLITGQSIFLDNYNATAAKIPPTISSLSQLTQDNQTQQKRIALLRPMIQQRLHLLDTAILEKQQTPDYDLTSTVGQGLQIT